MTITLTLDPETERTIEQEAARLGITMSEYVSRLTERSARPRTQRRGRSVTTRHVAITPQERLRDIIERADPYELKAIGLTLPDNPPKTGAEFVDGLLAEGLLNGFGDPAIDAPELARQIREQAQTRDWS